MTDSDSKRIIREWDREIDEELRRAAERGRPGRWRFVSWAALWALWLLFLVGVLTRGHGLR